MERTEGCGEKQGQNSAPGAANSVRNGAAPPRRTHVRPLRPTSTRTITKASTNSTRAVAISRRASPANTDGCSAASRHNARNQGPHPPSAHRARQITIVRLSPLWHGENHHAGLTKSGVGGDLRDCAQIAESRRGVRRPRLACSPPATGFEGPGCGLFLAEEAARVRGPADPVHGCAS